MKPPTSKNGKPPLLTKLAKKQRIENINDKLKFGHAMSSAGRRSSSMNSVDAMLINNGMGKDKLLAKVIGSSRFGLPLDTNHRELMF